MKSTYKHLFLYSLIAVLCSTSVVFTSCNKNESDVATDTETNNIQYGIYMHSYDYFDIIRQQTNTQLEISELVLEIRSLTLFGFNTKDKEQRLHDLCYDEFNWGYGKIIYLQKSCALIGYVPVYSNYKGKKNILAVGINRDSHSVANGGVGDIGTLYLQLINDGLQKYDYTVNSGVITIHDEAKTTLYFDYYNSTHEMYKEVDTKEEYLAIF